MFVILPMVRVKASCLAPTSERDFGPVFLFIYIAFSAMFYDYYSLRFKWLAIISVLNIYMVINCCKGS